MTRYRKQLLPNKYRYSVNNLILHEVFCKLKSKQLINRGADT